MWAGTAVRYRHIAATDNAAPVLRCLSGMWGPRWHQRTLLHHAWRDPALPGLRRHAAIHAGAGTLPGTSSPATLLVSNATSDDRIDGKGTTMTTKPTVCMNHEHYITLSTIQAQMARGALRESAICSRTSRRSRRRRITSTASRSMSPTSTKP